jgi:hypothetical protein
MAVLYKHKVIGEMVGMEKGKEREEIRKMMAIRNNYDLKPDSYHWYYLIT